MTSAVTRRLTAIICTLTLAGAFGQTPAPQAPSAPAPAQTPAATGAGAGPFNMNNVSLLEVLNELGRELHLNFVLDASVKGGSVTVNTFGTMHEVDLRPLLETILRMNNLAMVQAGNIYRIVPIANVARQPISPITETDPSKLPDDERMVMDLIFLRYATSSELIKVLTPF